MKTTLDHGTHGRPAELEAELRRQICDIGRNLWNRGMVAANDGNISARLPNGRILCTPTGVSKGYLTPAMLPIVALAFRRGWLLLLPLAWLPLMPATAEAMSWHDFWQRPDQQAAQALHSGDAKRAQQLARDPAWRGAAAYRAGDYASAAQALQQASGGDAAYNLGNALARQSRYPQAIAAYDHALKLDPGNADAKANRQAVEDWLRKQQQKQPQDKPQERQSGGNGDSSQSSSGGQGKDNKNGTPPQDRQSKQDAGKPSDQAGKDDPSQAQDQQGKDRSGKEQAGDQPKPLTPQQQAEQKAQAEQAQKALQQQMDQALAGKPEDHPGKPTHQLGAIGQDDPQAKLPADLRQALQRVPDDPGALLRRKFELEYLQRHGGAPNEDDQP